MEWNAVTRRAVTFIFISLASIETHLLPTLCYTLCSFFAHTCMHTAVQARFERVDVILVEIEEHTDDFPHSWFSIERIALNEFQLGSV
jgi:hypothetical protein